MSYSSFHHPKRHQNNRERFNSRSNSSKRTSENDFSQKNSRNFQNDSRQDKGGQIASRHRKAFENQTSSNKQPNYQHNSKKAKNHPNQTPNPIKTKQNFSNPRKFPQNKDQRPPRDKPSAKEPKDSRATQLQEVQNIDSNLLGKRELEQEDKADIDLEIEQYTLKKKIKVDEVDSVKTADSISTFSEPDSNGYNENRQKIKKISEAFSDLKQKVDELEKNLSPETKENMQKILDKNSKLSFKERLSNVMNFFQAFDLKKLH